MQKPSTDWQTGATDFPNILFLPTFSVSVCDSLPFLSVSSLQTDRCVQVFSNRRDTLYSCLLLSPPS